MTPNSALSEAGRSIRYRLVSRLYHHPALLRRIAELLVGKPSLARAAKAVADLHSVRAVFGRPWSFSTAQADNMRAGDFVIGMDNGARQAADRALLQAVLPTPATFGSLAAAEARSRLDWICDPQRPASFDLIDDYMVHVAWAPLAASLGPAANTVGGAVPDSPARKGLYDELRSLGAQLIIGSGCPAAVRRTADEYAAHLNTRVGQSLGQLCAHWQQHSSDAAAVHRNAVGLTWVGHPATVQAAALCTQQLLVNRAKLGELHLEATRLGDGVWCDIRFREALEAFVLEQLAQRPPFPILTRLAVRATWFEVGRGRWLGAAPAGSTLLILLVGALADRRATGGLAFGDGPRECIARHHVLQVLVSAMTGLLMLPGLRWADAPWRRMRFDGPVIRHMKLKFRRQP